MNPATYFLLPDGRLRAGWRFLLFLICWILATGLLRWALGGLTRGDPFLASFGNLAVVAVVSWAMLRLFDCRPFGDVGLQLGAGAGKALGCGIGVGAGSVAAVAVTLVAIGDVRFTAAAPGAPDVLDAAMAILTTTLLLVLAASFEELLFRGYPFQRLVEWLGAAGAVTVSALVFGYMHRLNPSASLFSTANTALAGVVLSLAYLRSRTLWYPIGWHAAWNWSMALAGFPVSGLRVFDVPWRAAGPEPAGWLHGGGYGPEGGAVATALLLALAAALWLRPRAVGCFRIELPESHRVPW